MGGMAVLKLIASDPPVTAVSLMATYFILQFAFDVGWPFTIAYAVASHMAIRLVQRRVPPDPGREAGG